MSYPTKLVKFLSPIALAISLAACGGDAVEFGGGGASEGGGDQVEQAKSIELSASTRQLLSDGSVPVIISAIAKNENNNAIENASVIFSVNNGATITTDTEGEGSVNIAMLTPGNPENRALVIKVSSGSASKEITIDVVGTNVVIDGPSSIALNKDVPFVLKLKDSADKPIAFEKVELTSQAGNEIKTESNFETDVNGEITFTLSSSADGSDVLIAKVLGLTLNKNIKVSDDEFSFSSASEEININTDENIKFTWKKNGVAQANKAITISATRGTISNPTILTDSAGEGTVVISSKTAGKTVITATSADGLSTFINKEFVATTPAYLNTQAVPSLIAPNGSSTIVAKIRDINNNPVKNKTIDFRLNDTVDGVLAASTAITDSLGRASVSYTAGNASSEKDGVEITTFIQGYSVEEDKVYLTVGGDALRIVLGHDQLIGTDDIYYKKRYGVIVTDSAGNPIKDQKIDFNITPTHYNKGFMIAFDSDGDGEPDIWKPYYTVEGCKSEDFNNNGKLDTEEGEDINGNGTLEPTHDATITNTGVTDEEGKITVEVIYPKSRALWSTQTISATTQVDGTEFVEYTSLNPLPITADDVSDIEVGPPNFFSPYGRSDSCADVKNTFNVPFVAIAVNAITGIPAKPLIHDVWYTVKFINALGASVSGLPFEVNSTVVTVETDSNGNFKLTDKNPEVKSSGQVINLTVDGTTYEPLWYQDDDAVVIEPEEPEDQEGPILNVNTGPSSVAKDSTYVDPGFNAVDVVDGTNITKSTLGAVDTAVPGTYTLIYSATDRSGNTTTVTRTIVVTP